MSRLDDKLRALEAAFAPPPVELARTFKVPVSLRLITEYGVVVAEAHAACGHQLTPDAVPLLDGDEQAWCEYASHHQARLIASAVGDVERSTASAAAKAQAEQAVKHPPKAHRKPPMSFARVPSIFDNPTRA